MWKIIREKHTEEMIADAFVFEDKEKWHEVICLVYLSYWKKNNVALPLTDFIKLTWLSDLTKNNVKVKLSGKKLMVDSEISLV